MAALGEIPRLSDDPEYAGDPVHDAGPGGDEAILTPDEELGAAHVFGVRPFTVVVDLPRWNIAVRYRVLDDRELLLCDEAATEDPQITSDAGRARLLTLHYLTRAVADIGGVAPGDPPETATDKERLGLAFAYFLGRKGPVKALLLEHFFAVQVRFNALLRGEHVPKSSGAPAGGGGS